MAQYISDNIHQPDGAKVSFLLAEYRIRLRFRRSGHLSTYIGNTLRGGFGKALRDVTCSQPGKSCAECALQQDCAYSYLFETRVPGDAPMMRLYPHAPHPFVLRPPSMHGATVQAGDGMDITLILIGNALPYFPFFILALERLGNLGLGAERVSFEISSITDHRASLLFDAQARRPLIQPKPLSLLAWPGSSKTVVFRLHYSTPMQIKRDGKILRSADFGALVSTALRRLELLCRLHGAGVFTLNAAALAQRARQARLVSDQTRWRDLSRYSRRQERCVPMGGVTGTADFTGDMGLFEPILSLASRIHVGKNTAFGHGFFSMEELSDDVRTL